VKENHMVKIVCMVEMTNAVTEIAVEKSLSKADKLP